MCKCSFWKVSVKFGIKNHLKRLTMISVFTAKQVKITWWEKSTEIVIEVNCRIKLIYNKEKSKGKLWRKTFYMVEGELREGLTDPSNLGQVTNSLSLSSSTAKWKGKGSTNDLSKSLPTLKLHEVAHELDLFTFILGKVVIKTACLKWTS